MTRDYPASKATIYIVFFLFPSFPPQLGIDNMRKQYALYMVNEERSLSLGNYTVTYCAVQHNVLIAYTMTMGGTTVEDDSNALTSVSDLPVSPGKATTKRDLESCTYPPYYLTLLPRVIVYATSTNLHNKSQVAWTFQPTEEWAIPNLTGPIVPKEGKCS
ncbi:hypothetical protein ASPBRDRAFT_35098 [Aspergillus brasiliensis CBS 101740]|uniref:Uncharacterized protein n=1 Tax=Aspergillus brasiliensis (strain CBS 101740 / IMI 381727 / IBT 21946) TaxID=767769 RepID=A0A1L9U3S7_ASPBC|nr:hypothetical protein ASPBRDRAFT_35098 [Aspergillus brasiliensis CBS 101740]